MASTVQLGEWVECTVNDDDNFYWSRSWIVRTYMNEFQKEHAKEFHLPSVLHQNEIMNTRTQNVIVRM